MNGTSTLVSEMGALLSRRRALLCKGSPPASRARAFVLEMRALLPRRSGLARETSAAIPRMGALLLEISAVISRMGVLIFAISAVVSRRRALLLEISAVVSRARPLVTKARRLVHETRRLASTARALVTKTSVLPLFAMVPTRRLAVLAAVAALVAVCAGYAPQLRLALAALDAAIVTGVLADVLFALGRRVEATREVAAILSVGRANVVTLHLRNTSGRTLRGVVADDPIAEATATGNPASFELAGHATRAVKYELVPTRRGPRDFTAITVRYASPLGLVARQERTTASAHADVYPDVHAARSLELLRRQGRQDARLGSMRVRGGDTDFERLRPYSRGDEMRHVDWRASARRDDLTVRQFQAESNQNVVFALDIGRAMRGESAGLTSVDHALNAALLTADVALRGGDKAGLMAFDDAPRRFVAPTGGRAGGRKLTRAVYALEAGLAATDYRAAVTFLRTQVRARSLFIMFTNLLEQRSAKELASSLRGLLPRHLPLCVLLRDTDVEALAVAPSQSAEDLYVRAAAAEALAWRDALLRQLRNSGVLVLDAKPGDVTPELVKSYLDVKARRLL